MISKKSLKFINVAIKEAEKSNILHKHGCVIVTSGKLMSKGFNNYRNISSDGFIKNSCTCHAEISAIRNYYKLKKIDKNKIKNSTIYIVRINKNGKLCQSAPCISCFHIITMVGIKKIVYSDDNGNITRCNTKNYNIKHITYGNRMLF